MAGGIVIGAITTVGDLFSWITNRNGLAHAGPFFFVTASASARATVDRINTSRTSLFRNARILRRERMRRRRVGTRTIHGVFSS